MAIEVAGKRFVTLADEFFVNGAKVYEAWANGVKVYPDISGIPAYMKITTLPNKLVYIPGETMDYTGIVCTLFNYDGTVFTDERYPDGTIPFEELEFPIEKAPAVGLFYVTDGIPGGRMEFPIPLYPIGYHFYRDAQHEENSYIQWYFPESDAYFIVNRIGDKGIVGACVSERNRAKVVEDWEPTRGYQSELASAIDAYTHDGKTAYYGSGTASLYNSSYESFFPESGSGPASGYINGIDAWNVLYGTREGDDSSISVNWKSTYSGDDRTLSDKFNISNREVTS